MSAKQNSGNHDKENRMEQMEEGEKELEKEEGEFVEGWVLRRPKTPLDWVKRWALNSSCNGIPNVQRSRHSFRKIVWLLLILTGTALTLRDVINTVKQFIEYPINVAVTLELKSEIEYPAVTICNLNPVRKSKLFLGGPEFEGRVSQKPSISSIGLNNHEIHELREYFHNTYSQLNDTIRNEMGHTIESMLLGCVFDGKNCSASDFSSFIDTTYGRCYSFNGEQVKTRRYVYKAGPSHALTLELFIEANEYVPLMTESEGMIVAVHYRESMPFPADTGVYISPGQSTSIASRRVEIIRKKSPYPSDCWQLEEGEAVSLSIYSELYDYDYSEEACIMTCYQRAVLKECGCGDPTIPMVGKAFNNSFETVLPCLTHIEEMCENRIKQKSNKGKLNCDNYCHKDCKEVLFRPTVSAAVWPNKNLLEAYEDKLKMLYPTLITEFTKPRENVAKVQIFFPDMVTEFVREQAAYTSTNLWGDLGGNIGFYLGVSIISLFEFFELIPDVIRSCFQTTKHKKKVKKSMAMKGPAKPTENGKHDNLGDQYSTAYNNAV